jgi:hypothetical protein
MMMMMIIIIIIIIIIIDRPGHLQHLVQRGRQVGSVHSCQWCTTQVMMMMMMMMMMIIIIIIHDTFFPQKVVCQIFLAIYSIACSGVDRLVKHVIRRRHTK